MTKLDVYLYRLDDAVLRQFVKMRAWRSKLVKLWVGEHTLSRACQKARDMLSEDYNVARIEKKGVVDYSLCYYEWDGTNAKCVVDPGVRALMSRSRREEHDFIVLDSANHPKDLLCGFADAPNRSELPDRWTRIPCVRDAEQLLTVCSEKGIFCTGLKSQDGFKKAGVGPIKGASVYKEISTGNFMHADTLHVSADKNGIIMPDHYECYDRCGKHLGEKRTIAGPIVEGTADSTKALPLH